MVQKGKRLICLILIFGLLAANILHENTPVQAAGDSSVQLYQWHQAKTVDDLKKYVNAADGKNVDYKGTWVPIIIVAAYGDGTSYYWNRNTKLAKLHDADSMIVPCELKKVGSSDEIGLTLANGIKSGKDFITKGDMGAMHMYYHGEQTSTYSDGSVTADAWSLTSDAVSDFSNDKPDTVYGIKNSSTYVAMDQNKVESWNGAEELPTTYLQGDSNTKFKQAWTFYQDRFSDCFLISNMYAWATKYKLSDGWSGIYAPTIGCALKGSSRASSPDVNRRNSLETTPSAAAVIYDKHVPGKVLRGEAARRAIISEFDEKYSESQTRVRFKIFVGQKIAGGETMKSRVITKNNPRTMGMGNTIPENTVISVEKGGTLVIPENATLYLDGTIVNEGTVIVEQGATVTTDCLTRNNQIGKILCRNGGNLLIMDQAKVLLPNTLELVNATMVNKGLVVVGKNFTMKKSQIQLADQGRLAVGLYLYQGPKLFAQMDFGTDNFSGFDKVVESGYLFSEAGHFYPICESQNKNEYDIDDDSKIVLEPTSTYEYAKNVVARKYSEIKTASLDAPVQGMDISGNAKMIQKETVNGMCKYTMK